MRKLVQVKFGDGQKLYSYFTELSLIKGAKYWIVADDFCTYSNPVTVVEITSAPRRANLRTITDAQCITAPVTRDDGIENVYFNEVKGTTVVVWKDGIKTKVKCQDGEIFDREKGLAMCFVKRFMDNRGAFNEIFKKWCSVKEAE